MVWANPNRARKEVVTDPSPDCSPAAPGGSPAAPGWETSTPEGGCATGGDAPLRILDPACGSGSFLLGAYEYLLRWYLDYYVNHDPESWAGRPNPPIYEHHNGRQPVRNPQSAIEHPPGV